MSTLTVQNILENRKGWIDLGNAFIAYCKFYKLIESAKLVSGDNYIHYDSYDDDYGDDEGTTSGNIFVRIDVDGKDLPSGTYEISLQGDYNSTFGEAEFLNVSNNRRTEITSDDFRYDEPQTTEEIEIDLVVDKLVSKYFITNKIKEDKKMNRKSLRENLFTDKKFPMTVSLDTIEPTVTSYPELSRSEFRNKIVNSDEHFVHRGDFDKYKVSDDELNDCQLHEQKMNVRRLVESIEDQAYRVAKRKHDDTGAVRKHSGDPYIVHPVGVAKIAKAYGGTEEEIAAAYLHDTIEDTGATVDDIREKFGNKVADIVNDVTNDPYLVKKLGKEEYINQELLSLPDSSLYVKLCDMYYNITDYPNQAQKDRIIRNVSTLLNSRRDLKDDRCLDLIDSILEVA